MGDQQQKGVWSYVKGGMGGLASPRQGGRTSASRSAPRRRWRRSSSSDGYVQGVALKTGEEFHAKKVATNLDPI